MSSVSVTILRGTERERRRRRRRRRKLVFATEKLLVNPPEVLGL